MSSGDGYKNGKPDLSWWNDRIEAGKKFRRQLAKEDRWETWRQYYRHEWADDVLPTNLYFKMLRTIVPRIYFRNPSASIIPAKPGLENLIFAKILERIDNKLVRQMGMKNQLKKIAQDSFMFGSGIGKLGYGAEFTPSPDELQGTAPTEQGQSGRSIEYNSLVQANMPWFMRAPTGSIIYPAGCESQEEARWIANEIWRTVEDVKKDPRLSNTSKLGPSEAPKKSQEWHSRTNTDLIQLYEVRDKKTRSVFVFSPQNMEQVLMFESDDLQEGGTMPFFKVSFNEDDEYVWGVPDSKILDDIQREANETRTLIHKHRRISVAKILAKNGSISEDEAKKMVSDTVQAVVQTEGDPLTDFRELTGNNIPEDLIRNLDLVMNDARETVGFSRNQMGEFTPGSGDTTATEAKIVQMASEIRVDERRDMMADMFTQVLNHVNRIIFKLWSEEEVVQISGPMNIPLWVKFRPDMLDRFQHEVKVDPDSSLPQTKERREQKAFEIFNALVNDPFTDQVQLRLFLANEYAGSQLENIFKVPDPRQLLMMQENPLDTSQAQQVFGQAADQGENADMSQILRDVTGGPSRGSSGRSQPGGSQGGSSGGESSGGGGE